MFSRKLLAEAVAHLPLWDTHEHLHPELMAPHPGGLWELVGGGLYVSTQFALAGAPALPGKPESLEEQWEAVGPHVGAVSTTGYFGAVWEALRLAFSVEQEELDFPLYVELEGKLQAAQQDPGWPRKLLRELGGLERALQDCFWDPLLQQPMDRELLDPVLRVADFIMAPWEGLRDHNGNTLYDFQDVLGVAVRGFADYLELFEALLARAVSLGAKGMKIPLAYDRDLDFAPVARAEAEAIWNRGAQAASAAEQKALQDFLTYHAVARAGELGWPVQIHTGMLEGMRAYDPAGKRPGQLIRLIAINPHTRFDLFHAGFPYARELGVLAMERANVWADLCWVPLISPRAAAQILAEWIDMVPGNKLLWGGDCRHPVAALGAALRGRKAVVEALALQLEAGAFGERQALRLAERILGENARELYWDGA